MIDQQKPKTAREEHDAVQFNVNVERATEQKANSFKQRLSKKRTFQEFKEEIEPEDAINLMFNYFDRNFEGIKT